MAEIETRIVAPRPGSKHSTRLPEVTMRPVSVHGARQTSSVRAAAGLMVETAASSRSTGSHAPLHASSVRTVQPQAPAFLVQSLDHLKPDGGGQSDAGTCGAALPAYRSRTGVGGKAPRQPQRSSAALLSIDERPRTEQRGRRAKRNAGKENASGTTASPRLPSASVQEEVLQVTPTEAPHICSENCSGQCCTSVQAQLRAQELERLLLTEQKELAVARKAEAAAVRARELEQAERRKAQDDIDALRRALEEEKQRSNELLAAARDEFRRREERAEEEHAKEKEDIREKHAKDLSFMEASLEKARRERNEAIQDGSHARQLLEAQRTRAEQLEQELRKPS